MGLHLPARIDGGVAVFANGKPAAWTAQGRTVSVSLRPGSVRTLSLTADLRGRGHGDAVVATMRGGKLAIPLR